MLKNNLLLSIVYGFLLLCIVWALIFSKTRDSENHLVFTYPEWEISFAGEVVPMENFYNKERFDKEFLLTSNNLYQFYLYVKRAPLYLPYIQEQLEENNIPLDLQYLPIAESALRNDVVSSAGAAGIWQFIPETARNYWLRVDDQIDERYHFEKSTQAAMKYLNVLYDKFWNWELAAAAYNRWENGLARDMESQNIDNYYDLYLNEETSRYVFRILAIKYVMQDYEGKKWVINKLIWWVYSLPETKTISVGAIENLQTWASSQGVTYQNLKLLNPWILWTSLPDWNWQLTLPL